MDLYLIHWPVVTGCRGPELKPSIVETWRAMEVRWPWDRLEIGKQERGYLCCFTLEASTCARDLSNRQK